MNISSALSSAFFSRGFCFPISSIHFVYKTISPSVFDKPVFLKESLLTSMPVIDFMIFLSVSIVPDFREIGYPDIKERISFVLNFSPKFM